MHRPLRAAAAARSRSRICDIESHRTMQEVTPSRYRSRSSPAGVSGARSEATARWRCGAAVSYPSITSAAKADRS